MSASSKAGTGKAVRKRVYFKLAGPNAKEVHLAGTFNDWDPESRQLKQNKAGVWSTWMMLDRGRYEYRYIMDSQWANGPDVELCANEFGGRNCVLKVT
jgi:1,4-alpha-glucan branching enzyme